MGLVILFIIWVVMGLAVGYYAPSIFKGARPYGLNGDLIAGVLTAILVGLGDWYLIPLWFPSFGRFMVFLAAIIEPLISILIVLWLMRYIKNR